MQDLQKKKNVEQNSNTWILNLSILYWYQRWGWLLLLLCLTFILSLTVLKCFVSTVPLNAHTKPQSKIRNLVFKVNFLSEGHIAYKWQSWKSTCCINSQIQCSVNHLMPCHPTLVICHISEGMNYDYVIWIPL